MFQRFCNPTHTHTLQLRNIYIMPTRAGLFLFITLNVLLLACINFQINLGYALTFLIATTALASTFTCYRSLNHLSLSILQVRPVFSGLDLHFVVSINNPDKRAHYGVALAIDNKKLKKNEWAWSDIAAKDMASVTLATTVSNRGWMPLPQLIIQTTFPLGIFRAWSFWQPAAAALIYPMPEVNPPKLPSDQADTLATQLHIQHRQTAEEFDGVRPYQPGDALRQIYWKKVLPNGELVSKQKNAYARHDLWLTQEATRLGNLEAQISRLTAWILLAHKQGMNYGLQLGALRIAPNQGEAHQLQCLQTLAIYQLPQNAQEAIQEKFPNHFAKGTSA